jgi:hypothetical protein
MVWRRAGSDAEGCRNSFRVLLRAVALGAVGDFALAWRAFFLVVPDFFSSLQSFKPYKSFDAIAEVNLYGFAEGGE